MKAKRRMEIMMETHELTIIRFRQNQGRIFCQACEASVSHLNVGQAALSLSLSETAILRLAVSGQIHSTETAAGLLLLCSNSLVDLKEGNEWNRI